MIHEDSAVPLIGCHCIHIGAGEDPHDEVRKQILKDTVNEKMDNPLPYDQCQKCHQPCTNQNCPL